MNQIQWDEIADNTANWFSRNWFDVLLLVFVFWQIANVIQVARADSVTSALQPGITCIVFWIGFFFYLNWEEKRRFEKETVGLLEPQTP